MIDHIYQDIEGWFDFPHVYREAIARTRNGGSMTEVRVCYGKSFFFLAVELARIGGPDGEGCSTVLHAVDPFRWPNDVWTKYQENLSKVEHLVDIRTHRGISTRMVKDFSDASQDFVFIDAEHTEEQVRYDIRAWWPKVKKGGVLAGHDWGSEFPGVESVTAFVQREGLHVDLRVILCEGQAEKDPKDARHCWWIEER